MRPTKNTSAEHNSVVWLWRRLNDTEGLQIDFSTHTVSPVQVWDPFPTPLYNALSQGPIMAQEPTRVIQFSYCISLVVITFQRYSDPVTVHPGESVFMKGLPYTLLTLVMGWWGFPFGPIFSIMALYKNFTGGEVINEYYE